LVPYDKKPKNVEEKNLKNIEKKMRKKLAKKPEFLFASLKPLEKIAGS
jgi:hypothetical protein